MIQNKLNALLPPLVLECPECGERYLISQNTTPSEEATLYSDGFFTDDFIWRTPAIIGCVTCELGFFPSKGKIIARPDWNEFNEKWSHIKKAEPPAAGSLVLELRARKKMVTDDEIAVRTELWYSVNHTETGRALYAKNEKFRQFWIENLAALIQLMPETNSNYLLLKAEMKMIKPGVVKKKPAL